MSNVTIDVAGVRVQALERGHLLALPALLSDVRGQIVVGHHNLHSIYLFHRDPAMRAFYETARLVHIDGMPLVWMGKVAGYPVGRQHRHTSLDWIVPFLRQCAEHRRSVFFVGSKPGVAERAVEAFRADVPDLVAHTHHGYFDDSVDSAESAELIRLINASGADVLLVGMGMPRQERWVAQNAHRINTKLIWTLGAFMDYFAGEISTPPRWMGALGLEWLGRLLAEPKRLGSRYLVEPWSVLAHFAAGMVRTERSAAAARSATDEALVAQLAQYTRTP
ncbi:WecB/TagA/CpsF family glycosyltransferase [Aggregicoccus sp. 17bor-14]|uniref:WecB/TagA/CpsF family glycosyltransferase n=1 Tax=Myxococcaceae TaxID=31 RepID=UPI00129CD343|nr:MULTISPECIES: WecB/TagA/CpsF family glycosyltransferase [Myxococcaceae]MBF5042769.1 WecB/TagA/CpsF family glycosyltransferase [Simulacricoccus sp. 17bor-14]MRI88537.1 WecB/TagA/CpsF family glycosyltransferase [Aggregicoccus sp. 17bor-14]